MRSEHTLLSAEAAARVEQVLRKPVTDLTDLDAMLTAFSSLDATPRTCTFFATIPGSEAAGSFDFDAFREHGVPLLLDVALAMPSLFAGVTVPILRTYSACGDGLTRKSLTLTPKYVSEGQKGSLSARLALNDATTLEVEGEADSARDVDYTVRVSHDVNDNNRVTPELNLKSGKMKYEWSRKLGGDNVLTATASPNDNVELEWTDNGARGAWTTKVNMPWGNIEGSDVSFARKFNL